jgi:hypothetical protein
MIVMVSVGAGGTLWLPEDALLLPEDTIWPAGGGGGGGSAIWLVGGALWPAGGGGGGGDSGGVISIKGVSHSLKEGHSLRSL